MIAVRDVLFRVRNLLAAASKPPRRVAARARNRLDRALHPRRQRRARKALDEARPVGEVLFICLGNICRSPYAEWRLRDHLAEAGVVGVRVRSSGFLSPGRPSPELAVQVARERGIDLTTRRSEVLSKEALRSADLVLVMTSHQQRDLRWNYGRPDALHLGDFEPAPIPRRDLPDPFGRGIDDFRSVYVRIDRATAVLARLLAPGSDEPVDVSASFDDAKD